MNDLSLTGEMETLFIPLYGRALLSRENRILKDPKAEEIVKECGYDFGRLKISKKTQVLMSMRSVIIDNFTKEYIKTSPNCTVLHLGCGLDSRFLRVDNGSVWWYDIDFPKVIGLKSKYYDETERYRLLPSSVTDFEWIEKIDLKGAPALIVAEGLLMYLAADDVKNLFLHLQKAFPKSVFIFDAYSRLTAKSAARHPSLKTTGSEIKWGFDDVSEVENFGEGISFIDKTFILPDQNMKADLDGFYRFMFGFASRFKTAMEAHRIFRFRL